MPGRLQVVIEAKGWPLKPAVEGGKGGGCTQRWALVIANPFYTGYWLYRMLVGAIGSCHKITTSYTGFTPNTGPDRSLPQCRTSKPLLSCK